MTPYHLHSMTEDKPLCSNTMDPIQQPLFVQKEALKPQAEALAGYHTGLIQLIQSAYH